MNPARKRIAIKNSFKLSATFRKAGENSDE